MDHAEWFDLKTPASPRRRARRRRAAGSPSRPWALCPLPILGPACRRGGYSVRGADEIRQGVGRHYAALMDRAARCQQSRGQPVRTPGMRSTDRSLAPFPLPGKDSGESDTHDDTITVIMPSQRCGDQDRIAGIQSWARFDTRSTPGRRVCPPAQSDVPESGQQQVGPAIVRSRGIAHDRRCDPSLARAVLAGVTPETCGHHKTGRIEFQDRTQLDARPPSCRYRHRGAVPPRTTASRFYAGRHASTSTRFDDEG